MEVKEHVTYLRVVLPDGSETLIDLQDAWILKKFPMWRRVKSYVKVCRYIKTQYSKAREDIYLHKLIFYRHSSPGLDVDHKNRNGLDNRRKNLRING